MKKNEEPAQCFWDRLLNLEVLHKANEALTSLDDLTEGEFVA